MRSILFCCLLFVSISKGNVVHAQHFINTDSLFSVARKAAFDDKDYNVAIAHANKALAANPLYTDVIVFLGRLYAWKKMPDSARYYFNTALKQDVTLAEAYTAYADVELWNDNKERAIEILDTGLTYHPGELSLLIRKAKIMNALRDYETAIHIVDTILSIDKKNTEARALAAQIRDNISKNKIGIKYDYVYFDKQFPDPWQFLGIDYTRQTRLGPVTAKINYANRFKTSGLQYELEAYPRFSKVFYTYLNIGYSSDITVFPKWRAGASLYANLPKAFEVEAGLRYLYFNTNTFIYTLYVGKYYNNFLFGARTYLTPAINNIAESYSVLGRYYYKGVDDYVGIMLSTGISPDDRRVNVQLYNNYKLRTYSCELTLRHSIRKLNIITFNCSILNQEYLPKVTGNQLQVGLGYIRRF